MSGLFVIIDNNRIGCARHVCNILGLPVLKLTIDAINFSTARLDISCACVYAKKCSPVQILYYFIKDAHSEKILRAMAIRYEEWEINSLAIKNFLERTPPGKSSKPYSCYRGIIVLPGVVDISNTMSRLGVLGNFYDVFLPLTRSKKKIAPTFPPSLVFTGKGSHFACKRYEN